VGARRGKQQACSSRGAREHHPSWLTLLLASPSKTRIPLIYFSASLAVVARATEARTYWQPPLQMQAAARTMLNLLCETTTDLYAGGKRAMCGAGRGFGERRRQASGQLLRCSLGAARVIPPGTHPASSHPLPPCPRATGSAPTDPTLVTQLLESPKRVTNTFVSQSTGRYSSMITP